MGFVNVQPADAYVFPMDLSAHSWINATTTLDGIHLYKFINDGSDFCQAQRNACVTPDTEQSHSAGWATAPAQYYGTAHDWSVDVVVETGASEFDGRTVHEAFDAVSGVDSCHVVGGFYSMFDEPGNAPSSWLIGGSNEYDVPDYDRVGTVGEVVKWYRGVQADMTPAQIAWINAGNPSPPVLAGGSQCVMRWYQHVHMECPGYAFAPFGLEDYHVNTLETVITETTIEVRRGLAPFETNVWP